MRQALRTGAMTLAAVLLSAAAPPGGWYRAVSLTPEGGHLIGNPQAPVRLIEYASYTCRDCATYNLQSEGVLGLAYLPSGRIAVEVRLLAETPIDLAAAMLASCGNPARFPLNHNALLRSQARWMELVPRATAAQRQRWNQPDLAARNRAIAADLKLYDVMIGRGYDRQTLERCLADSALAARLTAASSAAIAAGVIRTPGFSIGGKLLRNTHDWATLRPQLDESLN